MGAKLAHLWETVSSGYWFVPAVMALAAIGLASMMLYVDRNMIGSDSEIEWFYAGGSDGARELLSTIASSIVTIAGVVFSITIVALTQASSQFGPRLLRNFMRDRGNQMVLGTFVATFLYSLLVLRTIHGQDDSEFVPQSSVTVGVLLAMASMAVLIYFIHHVSISLQAPMVVAAVAGDLSRTLEQMQRQIEAEGEAGEEAAWAENDGDAAVVTSGRDGYVQAIDYGALVRHAEERDVRMRVECRPGDWRNECAVLLRIWPADRCDEQAVDAVRGRFILGSRRTPEQDVEFGFTQLVEVAVRALSTGVNDPFTAINCIDALGAALCRVGRCGLPRRRYRDAAGRVRVAARATDVAGLIDAAFNQIRQAGRNTPAVMIRLLEVIEMVAHQVDDPAGRQALRRHAAMVHEDGHDAMPQEQDRRDLRQRYESARGALDRPEGQAPAPSTDVGD